MEWKFSDDQPIYQQIVMKFKSAIAAGEWQAGDKLPSVRELAVKAGVNPNTMQKALAELEREGLVYSQRTAGRFVSDSKEQTKILQEDMMMQCIGEFVEQMKKLGYQAEDILLLVQKYLEKNERI